MFINRNIFIIPSAVGIIIWNFESHRQFELSGEYLRRLSILLENIELYSNKHPIDQEFSNAGILVERQSTHCDWGWDELSRIFHNGTKNIPFHNMPIDSSSWAELYLEQCTEALLNEK